MMVVLDVTSNGASEMSVQVQKGAVKFESIKAMAVSLAAKTGEPMERVYIRLYMRMRSGKNASKAFHQVKRKYNRKVELNTII